MFGLLIFNWGKFMKRFKMQVGDVVKIRKGDELIIVELSKRESGKATVGVHANLDWKIDLFPFITTQEFKKEGSDAK